MGGRRGWRKSIKSGEELEAEHREGDGEGDDEGGARE